jgi:arsenite methyltransferase
VTTTTIPALSAVGAVPAEGEALRAQVRSRYGAIARRVAETTATGNDSGNDSGDDCCEPTCCPDEQETVAAGAASAAATATAGAAAAPLTGDPITANLYSEQEAQGLPEEALLASLGCGNPTALAELRPGETVLDLGSGGGIDVLLSAKRVGPTGFAFGLDMTDEMLALANASKEKAGAKNVTFLKGTIEEIPLPANSVDVVISNCVINLSADKDAVLREAFRVLKPGGRFAVSDMVVTRELPASVQRSMEAWAGCVAGALHVDDYKARLSAAGFEAPEVQVTRTFGVADLDQEGSDCESCCGPLDGVSEADVQAAEGALGSAFIRATKPALA